MRDGHKGLPDAPYLKEGLERWKKRSL